MLLIRGIGMGHKMRGTPGGSQLLTLMGSPGEIRAAMNSVAGFVGAVRQPAVYFTRASSNRHGGGTTLGANRRS
jgi:hypothetical protein